MMQLEMSGNILLHMSHKWGQRPIWERERGTNRFQMRMIPCCLNCLVDGCTDEPDAFMRCRRAAKEER